MEPLGIFCKPAIDLKIVVLPIPDGPSKQIISPSFLIVRLKSKTLFNLLEAAALPSLFLIFWAGILIFYTSKYILSEK